MYNHYEEMKTNINDVLNWNEYDTTDFDELYDGMWIDDYITGNGSGSYTFNRYEAQEYVLQNMELLVEALEEFGEVESIGEIVKNGDWERADVTIRCYLLPQVLGDVLEERGTVE